VLGVLRVRIVVLRVLTAVPEADTEAGPTRLWVQFGAWLTPFEEGGPEGASCGAGTESTLELRW
jgi:hypothetical protein